MSEKILKVNDAEICAESFGNPDDEPILLIMGAMASMVWWDEDFCRRLAERGRFVIRYDNRDVGRSIVYEPGNTPYTVVDLTDDAIGVLDAYGIEKAHLIGMSLGGMIAQVAALRHPKRVSTITMISSSPFSENENLPPIDEEILEFYNSAKDIDWEDQKSVIDFIVTNWQFMNGSKRKFDEARVTKLAEAEVGRAKNILSMFNHGQLGGGEEYYDKIKEIKTPALIIHGTEDRVLPYPHALALKETILNAKLLTLEGAGHEINYQDWDEMIEVIIEHTI
jgi:pimeloyl-ACP methyl ester carboxylesterase